MKKEIIRREKDFLFDISGVHSANINERIAWVFENTGKNWLVERQAASTPYSVIIAEPFVVVSSTPMTGVCGFSTGKRHVHTVDFCDNIHSVKNCIEYHLFEDPIGPFIQVDLFVFDGRSYEKAPYLIGVYEMHPGSSGFHCKIDKAEEVFNIDGIVKKRIFEDPVSDFELDKYSDKKIFVEIPYLWEIWFKKSGEEYETSEYFSYKNLDTIVEEAAIRMYDGELEEVTAENSWYTVNIFLDKNALPLSDFCEGCIDTFEFFKEAITLDLKLNC